MAIGLPDDNDTIGLVESKFWKIIFGFPIILYVFLVLGTLLVIKYDSPKFLLMTK